MSAFSGYSKPTPRPMPVILLADVSGSMASEGKIQALNASVRQMLDQFKNGQGFQAEIQLAVITFGTNDLAEVLFTPRPARLIEWKDQKADAGTPMGKAFELALQMIEDRSAVPDRAFRATIILVTDGEPTDSWREPLNRLKGSPRGSKAFRLAIGIGSAAKDSMLREFHEHPMFDILHPDSVGQIAECFRYVSDSLVKQSSQPNPDDFPGYEKTDIESLGA